MSESLIYKGFAILTFRDLDAPNPRSYKHGESDFFDKERVFSKFDLGKVYRFAMFTSSNPDIIRMGNFYDYGYMVRLAKTMVDDKLKQ